MLSDLPSLQHFTAPVDVSVPSPALQEVSHEVHLSSGLAERDALHAAAALLQLLRE
jgi:hypothetical protein